MNMAGNLGSFITALAFPYLKTWTGDDQPFFLLGAVLAALSALAWLWMKPDRPVNEEQ
jgi:ACS family glucarate transporter-like MFS transporter